jgi:hypothetical protein
MHGQQNIKRDASLVADVANSLFNINNHNNVNAIAGSRCG